jgi:quercetin dioxygenase-like cupin family protein
MNRSHAVVAVLLAAAPLAGMAQDLAVSAGKQAKVVLDNDKVRVIELQMAPGQSTGMHSHGDNVVVFLSGGAATQTMADGTTRSMDRKPGEVLWSGPVTHDTRNTGKTAVHTLVIELKEPMAPEPMPKE